MGSAVGRVARVRGWMRLGLWLGIHTCPAPTPTHLHHQVRSKHPTTIQPDRQSSTTGVKHARLCCSLCLQYCSFATHCQCTQSLGQFPCRVHTMLYRMYNTVSGDGKRCSTWELHSIGQRVRDNDITSALWRARHHLTTQVDDRSGACQD